MSQITLNFEADTGVDFSLVKPECYTLGEVQLPGMFNTADGNFTSLVILVPQW